VDNFGGFNSFARITKTCVPYITAAVIVPSQLECCSKKLLVCCFLSSANQYSLCGIKPLPPVRRGSPAITAKSISGNPIRNSKAKMPYCSRLTHPSGALFASKCTATLAGRSPMLLKIKTFQLSRQYCGGFDRRCNGAYSISSKGPHWFSRRDCCRFLMLVGREVWLAIRRLR
jgi:hypothetical protein